MVLKKTVEMLVGRVPVGKLMSVSTYGMQLFVSIVGMVTSVGLVWMGRDPAVYLPIATSIIGYWLPAPKKPDPPQAVESVESVTSPADEVEDSAHDADIIQPEVETATETTAVEKNKNLVVT